MLLGRFWLVLFTCFGLLVENVKMEGEKKQLSFDVNRVYSALEKAVFFYEQNGNDLNLDAYFGLRIAQGNLFELTRQEKNTGTLHTSGLFKQVSRLGNLTARIGTKSLKILQRSSPQYYRLSGSTVTQPWKTANRYGRINPNLITAFSKRKLSDDILRKYKPCLARLLGSSGYADKPCNVTGECWEVMMREGEIGYVLTHQALYFMFAEQKGCLDILSTKLKEYNSSLEFIYDRICSNIYNQLQLLERVHPIKRIDADLMMEQSVVCGLLGYYEFLTPKRLKNVLDWQRPSGCYGNIERVDLSSQHGRRTMRKLLIMKELCDGCESHITGVGTALLSIYLRFLLEKNTPLKNKSYDWDRANDNVLIQ